MPYRSGSAAAGGADLGRETLLGKGRTRLCVLAQSGSELSAGHFASNDLMAIGDPALRRHRVPEDVSVIGFDGVEVGKYLPH